MEEQRTQFTFYESFRKAVSRIRKAADRAAAYDAICDYALYGTLPDIDKLSDSAAIAFELVKPNLDASRRKAKNGKRGGKAGANDKQSESKSEANGKQTESKKEIEKEVEYKKENEIELDNECYLKENNTKEKSQAKPARFAPPTLDEVRAYCSERRNAVDPERFVNYYTSNGWHVGKNKMKDWKAAVRTWEKGNKEQYVEINGEKYERRKDGKLYTIGGTVALNEQSLRDDDCPF